MVDAVEMDGAGAAAALTRRIAGVETEYGITCTLDGERRLGPDEIARFMFRPVIEEFGATNIFTANAGRLYLDVGSHPEFATAECDSVSQLVAHDRAGEMLLDDLAERAEKGLVGEDIGGKVFLFKNNVDSAGNSYGCHENYLVGRGMGLKALSKLLLPFLVTRQLLCGAGKIARPYPGSPYEDEPEQYCFSQRADHVWDGVSSATTRSRPIINTRDEPHADADEWRRLHVIIGDANLSQTATLLKLGTTSLVLDAIEDGVDFSDLKLREPVADVQRVSRDLACTQKLQLDDHVTHLTAIEIQRRYLERVAPYASDDGGREIIALWGEVLDLLETDPLSTAHLLDWTAKLKLMEGLRQRAGIGWDHPKLALIDIQYSDIDPARGLYHALVRRGAMTTIADDAEVERAVTHAPESTRAYLRGGLLRRFSDDVVAASWDSAIVDVGDEVVKLTISDVSGLGAGAVGKLLEEAPDIASLVAGLRDRGLAGLS